MSDDAESLKRAGIAPTIHPIDGRDGSSSGFGIYAVDGRMLAAIADEGLAREFMVFAARGHADGARRAGLLAEPPTRHCTTCGGKLAVNQRKYCSRPCAGTATTKKNRQAKQRRQARPVRRSADG